MKTMNHNGGRKKVAMTKHDQTPSQTELQLLLKETFFENADTEKVKTAVRDIVCEFNAIRASGLVSEARGLAVLGPSGAGKTESIAWALRQLNLDKTAVGDIHRPFLFVKLNSDATLRSVCVDILKEFGWPAKGRDNSQRLWTEACNYINRLETIVLVIDEIQHVRSNGKNDREALCGFLKSLVQPRQAQIIPIVVGMPDFHEVLDSDVQIKRRFDVVNMRALDPALDRAVAIQTLQKYANLLNLTLAADVQSKDFASRLLEASNYCFGELCVVIQRALNQVSLKKDQEITLRHFQDAHHARRDCLPEENPFVTQPF